MGKSKVACWVAALCVAGAVVGGSTAAADVINLADHEAAARFDTATDALATSWSVDGVNHLAAMGLWLSVDGAAQMNVRAIDATPTVLAQDTNFDPGLDRVTITWTGAAVEAYTRMTLRGTESGSGGSTLAQVFGVTNTGNVAATYRLFQYIDINVLGGANDDASAAATANTLVATDPSGSIIEVGSAPAPSAIEVALTTDSPSMLDRLNGPSLATPSGAMGLVNGDVAWLLAWDFELNPGQSFLVSGVGSITAVPEPATMVLMGLGGWMIAARRRAA